MPILDFKIPEQTRIIEMVSDQIARRLLSIMGFWQVFKDGFFVMNEINKSANFNTGDNHKRISDNRCDVLIVPNYNPLQPALEGGKGSDVDANMTTRRWMSGTLGEYPIFSDTRSNVYLYEVNIPTSIELEFTLKVKSIEIADLIATALYAKGLTGNSVNDFNDIYFQYGIPDRAIILLHRIFSLQKDLEQYKFPDYLKVGSNDRISLLVNRDNIETGPKQLIIQKTGVHVLGRLENDGNKPEGESVNKSVDRLSLTFRYVYQFGRPIIMRSEYPIMVNNEMIGERFIRKPLAMNIGDEGQRYYPLKTFNRLLLHQYKNSINLEKSYPFIQFPESDDFKPGSNMYKSFNSNYQHLFIGLLSIDVDPTNGSFSLSIDIKNEILPLLETRISDEITKVFELDYNADQFQKRTDLLRRLSIFSISIFSNENLVEYNQLELNDDFLLTVNAKLDISKRYRIVISQAKDLRIINHFYIWHMLNNTEYYGDLLSSHFQYLVENNFIRVLREDPTGKTSIVTGNGIKTSSSGPHNSFRLGRFVVIPTR